MKTNCQALLVGLLLLPGISEAEIIYFDVAASNTTGLSDWTERSPFGLGGSVWQHLGPDPGSELATTIGGLTTGQEYSVSIFFWDDNGLGGNDWSIAAGLTSGLYETYQPNLNGARQAYNVDQSIGITGLDLAGNGSGLELRAGISEFGFSNFESVGADEFNRDLWVANVGTAIADGSGEIRVYPNYGGVGHRTWFDGVGVQAVPEPSSYLLLSLICCGFAFATHRKRCRSQHCKK